MSLSDAAKEPGFAHVVHARYDGEKTARKAILDLPSNFSRDIKKDPNPNDCPQQCKPNKIQRIADLEKLIGEVDKDAQQIQKDAEERMDLSKQTFTKTIGRLVRDSVGIVKSIMKPSEKSPGNIGKALADLGQYLDAYNTEATTYLGIYITLVNLAIGLKGRALNLAIYEEQMIHSPTCTDH